MLAQARSLLLDGHFDHGADAAGVAKVLHFATLALQAHQGRLAGRLVDDPLLVHGHFVENLTEFVLAVVIEGYGGEAALGAVIHVTNQIAHFTFVAGSNEDGVGIFRMPQIRDHGTEGQAAFGAVFQLVHLVQEDDTALVILKELFHVLFGFAAGDEVLDADFLELVVLQVTHARESIGKQLGHGGFAGAGVAFKEQIEPGALGRHAKFFLLLLQFDLSQHAAHLALGVAQANHSLHLLERILFARQFGVFDVGGEHAAHTGGIVLKKRENLGSTLGLSRFHAIPQRQHLAQLAVLSLGSQGRFGLRAHFIAFGAGVLGHQFGEHGGRQRGRAEALLHGGGQGLAQPVQVRFGPLQ